MSDKQPMLYHGSCYHVKDVLRPILLGGGPDRIHTRAAVFATERPDIAALFMVDAQKNLLSIGFEDDIAYICIWGTADDFSQKEDEGFLYVLPGVAFEKIGKPYEWQSFEPVSPIEVRHFASAMEGMMRLGSQVYFVHDDVLMDKIVADKENRAPILRSLVSENQRRGINPRFFG